MPLIQTAIGDQTKPVAKGPLVPTNLVMGHGTKVIFASNDQLAKTVGQVGLLGASLNGGPVSGLTGTAPLSTVGSVTANVSSNATTVVNDLLGSGPAVSVSSSAQVLSLLNAAPSSGGTITITPAVVNAGADCGGRPNWRSERQRRRWRCERCHPVNWQCLADDLDRHWDRNACRPGCAWPAARALDRSQKSETEAKLIRLATGPERQIIVVKSHLHLAAICRTLDRAREYRSSHSAI